jgi:hypothetical protein
LTSPRRLSPACESKNTNKSKEEHNSIAGILKLSTRVGFHKPMMAKMFLTDNSKQNPNPNGEAAAVYEDSRILERP